MSDETPIKARDLKAGQRVYVRHLQGWYTLASDAKTHRLSRNVIRLEFDQIPNEYRPAEAPLQVRPPTGAR